MARIFAMDDAAAIAIAARDAWNDAIDAAADLVGKRADAEREEHMDLIGKPGNGEKERHAAISLNAAAISLSTLKKSTDQ